MTMSFKRAAGSALALSLGLGLAACGGMDATNNFSLNSVNQPVVERSNYVLDLHLNRIGNARQLGLALNQIAGVVENGLFVDICDTLILGHGEGKVERFELDGAAEVTQFDFLAADNIFTDISD